MKTTLSLGLSIALSVCSFVATAGAAPITVANYSFETPTIPGPPANNYLPVTTANAGGWTISGPGSAYVQQIATTGLSGGDQIQFGQSVLNAGEVMVWSQDLGTTFQANTRYTVDIEGVKRTTDSSITNVPMQFGLASSVAAPLTGSTLGTINLPNLTPNVFVDAAAAGADGNEFTFTTGAVAPLGDLVVFIQNVAGVTGSNFRIQFDDVRVDATVVPEPGTVLLMLQGLAGIWFVARRRNKTSGRAA